MDIVEYAIFFATKAHKGQRRKQKDVDMIFHPFTVGMILQRNGYDEDVVAAGILHDVVEDTQYTFDDIEREFGEDKVLARNPEEQKWYYTSVYNSCIENVDSSHPIFVRYKKILEEIWE